MASNNFPQMPFGYKWLRFLRTIQATVNLTISIVLSITVLLLVLGGLACGAYYLYIHYFQYLPKVGGFHE